MSHKKMPSQTAQFPWMWNLMSFSVRAAVPRDCRSVRPSSKYWLSRMAALSTRLDAISITSPQVGIALRSESVFDILVEYTIVKLCRIQFELLESSTYNKSIDLYAVGYTLEDGPATAFPPLKSLLTLDLPLSASSLSHLCILLLPFPMIFSTLTRLNIASDPTNIPAAVTKIAFGYFATVSLYTSPKSIGCSDI